MNQIIYALKSSIRDFRLAYLFKRNNGYGVIRSTYKGLKSAVNLFRYMTTRRKRGYHG